MKAIALIIVFAVACGAPFESASPRGTDLAGAPSAAGSIAAAGSLGLSGSAGSGGASTPSGGAAGDAGAQEPPQQAGDGGAPPDMPPAPTPCSRANWRATASTPDGSDAPANALDGLLETRWSTRAPQEPGQWFEVELGGAELDALTLDAGKYTADVPATLSAELDGAPVAVKLDPAPGRLTVHFASPRTASRVRLVLKNAAPSWWSIAELEGQCL